MSEMFDKSSNSNAITEDQSIKSWNSVKRRKLILHFDNRNTLQVANCVSATTIEQGVNNFLTGVLWGHETEQGEWKWISTHPSLEQPAGYPDCITYFKYLENQIVKEAIDRKDLRAKTGSFVQNEGACFRQFYDELIESLRYFKQKSNERQFEDKLLENPENEDEFEKLSQENPPLKRRFSAMHLNSTPVNGFRSMNGIMYHYVFPAFFRLIKHLQETNRDFVIYLRTMGDDSKNFLQNAQRVLSNEHPSFQYRENIIVNPMPGLIQRPSENSIALNMKFPDDQENPLIVDEIAIHEKLISGKGVHAIKDDFTAWCRTNYHYTTSKPVWFDPNDSDPESHHILFDDNFRVIDENDCIVDIRVIDREKNIARSCPFEYYQQLENVFAVQANLYSILGDEDYYIKKVEECERNLDSFLHNAELLDAIKRKCFFSN